MIKSPAKISPETLSDQLDFEMSASDSLSS
jgi:hypothetical protein